jgi:hypothetical protein
MKILGINNVGFDVTDQQLIRFSAFDRCGKTNGRFDFVLEYAIRKVQVMQVLKLSGTHQVLACVDDVNPLGDNKQTNSVALSPRANYTD